MVYALTHYLGIYSVLNRVGDRIKKQRLSFLNRNSDRDSNYIAYDFSNMAPACKVISQQYITRAKPFSFTAASFQFSFSR
jgi:hypothetical protein